MQKPEVKEKIEVVMVTTEVLLEFRKPVEAAQFSEWWEQEGWELFKKWTETPSE